MGCTLKCTTDFVVRLWLLYFQVGLYLGGSSASATTSAATKCADLLRSRKDPCLQGTVLPFEYEVRHSMGGCNHVMCCVGTLWFIRAVVSSD